MTMAGQTFPSNTSLIVLCSIAPSGLSLEQSMSQIGPVTEWNEMLNINVR